MVQREVLEKISAPMLAAYLVWLPVQPNDNEYHAARAQQLAPDFWMHQLSCMPTQELRLKGEALRAAVESEFESVKNVNADF